MALTIAQLKRSLHLTETIESLQSELHSIYGSITGAISPTPVKAKGKRKKGGMSAVGRARIAAAQKARWAKVKSSATAKPAVAAKGKKKSKMSAKGRAAIVAAQKARWAKVKAAKGTK